MLSPRLSKITGDLWQNRGRTLLVILAIALGVFAISWISVTYSILVRELRTSYLAIKPASSIITTDAFDAAFVQQASQLPGVSEAEGSRTVWGRFQVGADEWRTILLFVLADYTDNRINRLVPEAGAWPPPDGEILLERAALTIAKASVGDTMQIRVPGSETHTLRVAGTVHDVSLPPAWQEGMAYGYITLNTLEQLGVQPTLNQLRLVVADDYFDSEHVRIVTNEVKDWVVASGRSIYQIRIPPPGEHPHADQMSSLLMLQQAFGLLALVLSSALVANMISALLAQQIRQIGVMKAIGGRANQVMALYFGAVLVLSSIALAVALPAGIWAGKIYAGFVAKLLNFNLVNQEIPHWVILLQMGVGLVIPLLAAAYPVYRGGRISVRQAINDYGTERENFGSALVEKLLARWQAFGRPLLLSLGNTFRRQGRLLLTLLTLAAGGATFMAALNLNAAMMQTLNVKFESNRYDLEVTFNQPYPVADIEQAASAIPGVVQAEAWGETEASLMYADGTYGNRFWLFAPPSDSTLLNFPLLEGRWLRPDDQNALVISHNLLADNPNSHVQVGDEIVLRIDGRDATWQIVGLVRQVAAPPAAFANDEALARVTGQTGFARGARLVTAHHDEAYLQAVKRDMERTLQAAGLAVRSSASVFDSHKVLEEHSVVLVSFMMLMTLMSVIVGGLGLMTTMSINVLERTREIGVMRALGASNLALLRIILIEGGLIGLLSWAGAVLLALPTSYLFGNVFGRILLETPLDFAFNPIGIVIWLVVVLVFSTLASFLPAWNAVELTVRDVLAYE